MGDTFTLGDYDPDLAPQMLSPPGLPPRLWESNGCTMSPDGHWGIACHFHDYAYAVGGDRFERQLADHCFYWNLQRAGMSRRLAGVYYRRVRLSGGAFFCWRRPRRLPERILAAFANLFHRWLPVPLPDRLHIHKD